MAMPFAHVANDNTKSSIATIAYSAQNTRSAPNASTPKDTPTHTLSPQPGPIIKSWSARQT